jgi:hypothetical protein
MTSYSVPTTNTTCCEDGGDEAASRVEVDVLLTAVFFTLFGISFLMALIFAFFSRFCSITALAEAEEHTIPEETQEERKRKRQEYISNKMIVKEWVPHACDLPVESTEEGDQDTPPPSSEKTPAPPPINSSLASCVMGSDNCEESVAGEQDERAGCAICLSHFKPQQLVCESSNSSCQHVFHKDCMVDWIMKDHDDCPMCREVYLLKTV